MRKKQDVTPKVGSPDFINDMGTEEGWSRLQSPSPVSRSSSSMSTGGGYGKQQRATSPEELSPKTVRRQSLQRLQEMIERNRHLKPHLRSSYVVEGLEGLATELCDENHIDPERAH